MGIENQPSGFWRTYNWFASAPPMQPVMASARRGCIACQDTFSPFIAKTKTKTRDSLPSRSIIFKSARARATPHSSRKRRTMRAATAILALVVVSFNLLNLDSRIEVRVLIMANKFVMDGGRSSSFPGCRRSCSGLCVRRICPNQASSV